MEVGVEVGERVEVQVVEESTMAATVRGSEFQCCWPCRTPDCVLW